MKNLLIGFIFLALLACNASSQNYYENTFTLEWDASPGYEDDTPFLPTDEVAYEIGCSTVPVTDPDNPQFVVGGAMGLTIFIAVPVGSDFLKYAARTKLTTDEGQTILYSIWEWADWQVRRPAGKKPYPPGNPRKQ